MPNDPSYVRLAPRLTRGIVADVTGGSGWSIAGLDVRQFPKDNRLAARFVRQALSAGKLEPASKAEWEEAHDSSAEDELRRQRPELDKDLPLQEASLRRAAAAGTAKVRESRGLDDDSEFYEEVDAAREDRKARIAGQKDAGLDEDDPEAQADRSGRRSVASARKRPGSRSKKESSE